MDKDTKELIDLIEDALKKIDEEMDHGCYCAPDVIPIQFEDEEDYYMEHDVLVNIAVGARMKLREKINELKNRELTS